MIRVGAAIFLVFSITFFACNDTKPKEGNILSKEKMQAVLWDFLQADAFTEFYIKKDSSKNFDVENAALQKKIFSIHNISKDDFYSSFDYYNSRSGDMRVIIDSIATRAERQRSKMMQRKYYHPEKEN